MVCGEEVHGGSLRGEVGMAKTSVRALKPITPIGAKRMSPVGRMGKVPTPKMIIASDLELMVMKFLVDNKIPFDFQSQLIGGYVRQMGDVVVDFLLTDLNIVLRVQGIYWHRRIEIEARDRIAREHLIGLGYRVVDLWQDDLQSRFLQTMRMAIQGEEVLRG